MSMVLGLTLGWMLFTREVFAKACGLLAQAYLTPHRPQSRLARNALKEKKRKKETKHPSLSPSTTMSETKRPLDKDPDPIAQALAGTLDPPVLNQRRRNKRQKVQG